MTDQPFEFPGVSTLVMSQDLRDSDAGIVVTDALGHTSEELERSDMSLHKRFGALTGKGHYEHRIGVDHAHYKEGDLLQYPIWGVHNYLGQ